MRLSLSPVAAPLAASLWAMPAAIAIALPPATAVAAPPPAATALLPKDTAMVFLVDMSEAQREALMQFQFFRLIETVADAPLSPEGLPFVDDTIDYRSAIAPWLGDRVTIALLPMPNLGLANQATFETQSIVLAPIAEKEAFAGFIDLLVTTRPEPPIETTYQGIPILYWEAVEAIDDDRPLPPTPPPEIPEFPQDAAPPEIPAFPQDAAPPEINQLQQEDAIPLAESPLSAGAVREDGDKVGEDGDKKAVLEDQPDIDFDPEIELPRREVIEPGLAIAVLNDHLIVAADVRAIRQLIDSQSAAVPSLAETYQFQRTMDNDAFESSLFAVYGNVGEINQYSLQQLRFDDLPLPFPLPLPDANLSESDLELLSRIDSTLEAFVKLQPEGMRFQGRVYLDDPLFALLDAPPPVDGSTLFSLMPAPTYLMVNSQDLAHIWQLTSQVLESFDETREWLDFSRAAVNGATGLDLDRDIFGWMDGNYAFFLFPTRQGLVPDFSPRVELGIGAMIQTSDRPRAESTLQTLDDLIASFDFVVQEQLINGVPAVGWGIDFLDSGNLDYDLLGHSWITEDTLVLTSGAAPLSQLLNPVLDQPLSEHYTFQRATESLPHPNQGYYYVNFGSTLSMVYQAFGPWIPEDEDTRLFKQFLGSIHSFSLTTSQTRDYLQLDVLTVLAPARPAMEPSVSLEE